MNAPAEQSKIREGRPIPGWIPAGLGGMLLGLLTQLHYLGFIAWELPWLRILGGMGGGFVLGCVICWILGKGLSRIRVVPKENPMRAVGWALLITAAVAWPLWDALALRHRLWMFCLFWLLATFGFRYGWERRRRLPREGEGRERRGVVPLLILVLAWGIFLRFSGLTHGLPDYIVHCDTPKQLALIPHFVEGNLEPPGRYPVGHIYLYSGVIRLWKSLTGLSGPVPPFGHESRREFFPYLVAVRSLQALLASAIPLFVFLFGRNLWGPWVGLLASFLVACDPLHLTYARQEMGEVPQFFWVILSLYFSSRILSGKRGSDGWWAGLFAGLAVATKMYGGYVVLAALGAVVISRGGFFRRAGLVLLGLIAGLLAGSPYFWVDPAGWWNNTVLETIDEFYVRTPTAGGNRTGQLLHGLHYLWYGLSHRFHFPWLILSLGCIVWLCRHLRKNDLVFLIPFGTSVLLIGFALTYLREWDLVNLTPYLSMVIAVGLSRLYERWGAASLWNKKIFTWALTLFLLFQGSVALRDALLARFPDTRELARHWIIGHADPETLLYVDAKVSGANWVPVNPGWKLVGAPAEKILSGQVTVPPASKVLAVVERLWWDPPLPKDIPRLQIFDLRSTYFENPEIYFFDLSPKRNRPEIILPHIRVLPPKPAVLETSLSYRRPLDLLSDVPFRRSQDIFSRHSLGTFVYAVLGEGRGSLRFGPALGLPIHAEPQTISCGTIHPRRRLWPWFPRSYRLALSPHSGTKGLWVGLFPDPVQVFPLLARFGAWAELEALARDRIKGKDFPAEARLFYAAALAARNKSDEAKRELTELDRLHPGFRDRYLLLSSGADPGPLLEGLGSASKTELALEDVYWPGRSGDPGELDQKEPQPTVLAEDRLFHIWMPQTFLPSFLKADISILTRGPWKKGTVRLKVVSVQANTLVRELVRLDLSPGREEIQIPIGPVNGPMRLEFRIEAEDPIKPMIRRLHISTDFQAEFRWRRQLLSRAWGKSDIP